MADVQIKQHIPIFVSSTYEDLVPYRNEVERNLVRLEQIIKGMEYFGSDHRNSLEVCLSKVRECKLFIGILGMRYGSVAEESGMSYTQLEYNEAIKNNIPTLIYIISEEYPMPPKYVDRGWKSDKLADFKENLKKQHTVSFFTSPDDLAKKVIADVTETLSSMEKVSVDVSKEIASVRDYEEVIHQFLLRPAKYRDQEMSLSMRVVSDLSGSSLKDELVRNMGLELGNTVAVDVIVLDKNGRELPERKISVYAEKENADWLEKVSKGDIITAKVRTAFCAIKEISSWDEGRLLRNSTYVGLVVLAGEKIRSSSPSN